MSRWMYGNNKSKDIRIIKKGEIEEVFEERRGTKEKREEREVKKGGYERGGDEREKRKVE